MCALEALLPAPNNQSLCTHGSSVIKNNLIHFIIVYTANQNTGLSKNNNFVLSKYMVIKNILIGKSLHTN